MNQYKVRIRDMREEDRPRNRLINNGTASLSNHELLSIIIRSGSVQENALSLSQRIFATYDLLQLSAINIKQLMAITGIKEGKAAQIDACFELARRLESFTKDSKIKINSPEDVYRYLYPGMREQKNKFFIELCLDTKNQVLRRITKKLVDSGKMLGIDVIDHVIIGDGRHFSMKEAGHI